MPIITAIDTQKQTSNRYNIYIDNVFAFGISENTLIAYRLHKGMDISDTLKNEIITHNSVQKIYSKALNYLSYSLRSEHEVREKLLSDDTLDPHVIELVITQLKEENYINDMTYATTFVQSALALTKKSKFVIEKALQKKGIEQHLIDIALEQIDDATEYTLALEVAQKYQAKQHHLSYKNLVQKIKLHLVQKGFSFSIAEHVISELDIEQDEYKEWNTLCYQGNRLWQKYRLTYEGNRLKEKMIGALYQKGFNYDVIKRYINEKLSQQNFSEEINE
ncbi:MULTISPECIES: recombination regulator RecX [unclassified Granulicatella]|uniref:recombination regulator RecX n=1 Tax=unclassified Granulicatella TaxID=2630493 RepID=UPI0010733891|nr:MULTISPECIES: recombination regulator RecX [unclassified Granulicatella]MBF0780784.1 recombination regulator RecX [Granulicatella sp. 19428wC4_WM01]TFU93829.1 recombination regulator RecX [Granulicatella sp. WM01]